MQKDFMQLSVQFYFGMVGNGFCNSMQLASFMQLPSGQKSINGLYKLTK